MPPTTRLNIPNSHTQGAPESRRFSWSNPLPRECSGSCALVMFVGSRWITEWHTYREYIATATSWPSGLLNSHPLVMPYPYVLASTADKRRGSLTHYPTHRALANRSPTCLSSRCLFPYFDNSTPISIKLIGLLFKKNEKAMSTGLSGSLLLVSAT